MINPNSKEGKKLIDAFKVFKMTPDGEMIMEYLQAVFLYPNPGLSKQFGPISPEQELGHHRVITHMLAMINQP